MTGSVQPVVPQPVVPIVTLRGVGKTFASGTIALDGLDLKSMASAAR